MTLLSPRDQGAGSVAGTAAGANRRGAPAWRQRAWDAGDHCLAMPKLLTALPDGVAPDRFCLVAPAGERRHFVNRHDSKGPIYTAGVDFTPKTYADLIAGYDLHPERKFAAPDGQPCRPETKGLLHDLPLVVSTIRHVGKEGNELEAHQAGLVTESERQLEYHDLGFEDLVAALQEDPDQGDR
jgi:hypothetical protein